MEEDPKFQRFIEYNNSIYDYDKKISSFDKSPDSIEGKGYLVDYDNFHKLKQLLNYDHFKTYKKRGKEEKINTLFNSNNFDKIEKLKAIEARSPYYIKNIIININCVLITEELFNLVFFTKEKPITFSVQKKNLTLKLKKMQLLELKHNNLVLDYSSFDKNEEDYDEIKNIYDSIRNYFTLENKIIEQLNQNKIKYGYGLLVRNSWLNEWKKYTNYEYLKEKYFYQYEKYNKEIEKLIFNEIIDYREKNNNRYPYPSETDIIKVNNVDELKNILKEESLVIIDLNFKKNFSYFNYKNDQIQYEIYNGEIAIKLRGQPIFLLKSENNILSFNNINEGEEDLDYDLIQLIKIYCFQRSLPDFENKNAKSFKIGRNNIILINKSIIQKYKDNFGYSELIPKLENIINSMYKIKKNGNIIDYDKIEENILNKIISELIAKYNYQSPPNNNFSNNITHNTFEINKTKKFEYIDNFELINEDISNYFLEQKIINKNDIIRGEIIVENTNIFLAFNYQNKNFYEIGYLNVNRDFIIEYVIKGADNKNNRLKDNIINSINLGLQKFLDQDYKDNQKIWGDGHISIGYFYHINKDENNKSQIQSDNNEIIENEFVNGIISFIIFIHSFNLEIKEKINRRFHKSYSKKDNCINGYLINKDILSKIKKLIYYEEISKTIHKQIKNFKLNENEINSALDKIISEKDGYFCKMILDNKKEIIKLLKGNQYKNINFEKIDLNNENHFYPTNFEIINEKAYICLLKVLGIEQYDEELILTIINKKIYIQFLNAQDYNLNEFLFGYILNNSNNEDIIYEIKTILKYNNEKERNNDFERIIKGKNLEDSKDESEINDENGRKIGKVYLIDNNNQKNNKNNSIIENEDYTNLKNLISYCIILYNEYSNIQEIYNYSDIQGEEEQKEYYFVNPNYLRELESILYFPDIKEKIEIINKRKEKLISNDEMIEAILNEIKREKKADKFNQNDIKKFDILNNRDIYDLKINNKLIDKKYYNDFSNCQIITKEIYELLCKLDSKFIKNRKYKSIICFFRDGKLIINDNKNSINIGKLENNIFVQEFLIYSNDKRNSLRILTDVYDSIKMSGYKYMKKFFEDKHISYEKDNSEIINANIYYFNEKEKNEIVPKKSYEKKIINECLRNTKSLSISDELKNLISLLISRQITERSHWRNKKQPEEVFLLDKNYIEQFDSKDIKDLSENISSIISKNSRTSTLNNIYLALINHFWKYLIIKLKIKNSKKYLMLNLNLLNYRKKILKFLMNLF